MGRQTAFMKRFSIDFTPWLSVLVLFVAWDASYAMEGMESGFVPASAECSSWVSVGDASEKGVTILHKNRDKTRAAEIVMYRKESGKNAYIAVSNNPGNDDVGMGINECGLAVTCNVVCNINMFGYLAPVNMNRNILENCGSVEEAYEYINDNKNKVYNEAIFFIADGSKAAVVECHSCGTYMEILPYEDCLIDGQEGRPAYAGRANRFEQYDNVVFSLTDHNERRYDRITGFLEDHEGSISPLDSFWLARDHYNSESAWFFTYLVYTEKEGAVCNQPSNGTNGLSTISGATFVIDSQYPELSTMWVALGAPDSTFFVPIHAAIMWLDDPQEAIPANWASSEAYDLSESIREKGWWQELYFSSTRNKMIGVEKKLLQEENKVRGYARWLMYWGWKKTAYKKLAEFDNEAADIVFENLSRIDSSGILPCFVPLAYP